MCFVVNMKFRPDDYSKLNTTIGKELSTVEVHVRYTLPFIVMCSQAWIWHYVSQDTACV